MTEAAWDRMTLLAVALVPTLTVVVSGRVNRKKTEEVAKKVDEVHTIANDRLTKALERIEELVLEKQRAQDARRDA